ncbi:MAG TPA: DoxX family protein [Gemmatimonadaceae bacterium]
MQPTTLRASDRNTQANSHPGEGRLPKAAKRRNVTLWTVQVLLAALYVFAGWAKLSMPLAALAQATHLPGPFMRFIAVCELLGALGLVLPGLFRVRLALTPIAAAGLVIIMIGATVVTLLTGQVAAALPPFVVGLFAAFVARGRAGWATRRRESAPISTLEAA